MMTEVGVVLASGQQDSPWMATNKGKQLKVVLLPMLQMYHYP